MVGISIFQVSFCVFQVELSSFLKNFTHFFLLFLFFSFIIFSNWLLFLYVKAMDFCMLILHPTTLLNFLIISSSYPLITLTFLNIKISSAYIVLSIPFSFLMLPIALSCLIALAKLSNTVLKNKEKESILVLFCCCLMLVFLLRHIYLSG